MTENSHISDDALQSRGICICNRFRRAARLTSKVYDRALKPVGLRNSQFTALVTLDRYGPVAIGELAELMATDGTTLTRNLEVLARRGLVEDVAADDARTRVVAITDLGKQTRVAAVPLWREAQVQVLEAVGSKSWSEMRVELDKIEDACAKPEPRNLD